MDARKPSRGSPTRSSAARPRAGDPAPARASRGGAAPPRPAEAASTLLARFDRDDFPATLYVEGPSEPLKAAFLAELRAAWAAKVPEAPTARVLRAAENGVEEILASYQGVSLFAPRQLTLVLEVEDLGRSDKRVAALAGGIGRPAGGSTLVLVESEADAARKSLDPLRAAATARWVAEPPDRAALLGWGTRRLRREGIVAAAGVLEAVSDACEGDALAFFNELAKICAWAEPGRPLSLDDAQAVLRPAIGAGLDDYLMSVARGETTTATIRLGRLLASGMGEGEILFSLSNLVGGALGGWAKNKPGSFQLARRVRAAELAVVVDALYRAEAAWKSGRADPVALLEQATRSLCGTR